MILLGIAVEFRISTRFRGLVEGGSHRLGKKSILVGAKRMEIIPLNNTEGCDNPSKPLRQMHFGQRFLDHQN